MGGQGRGGSGTVKNERGATNLEILLGVGLAIILIIVAALVLADDSGQSEVEPGVSTTVTTPTAVPAEPVPETVDSQQLDQWDSVLGAIGRFWETDPAQVQLWKEREKDACERTYDLEVEYQDATIQAFIEEHCTGTSGGTGQTAPEDLERPDG